MGRPLNKKYFGNRNIGTGGYQVTGNLSNSQNYSDDRIGGEGVASYTSYVAGSGWTAQPTASISAPTIPGGVNATGVFHYKALSFSTTVNGTGYAVGDVLEVNTGTAATKARAPIAAVLTVNTPNISNGGTMYDINSPTDGDKVTFNHANFTVPLRVRITAVTGSTATQIVVEQAGVWTGTGAPPTTIAGGSNGFTAVTTPKTGGDDNGNGLVLNGVQWGAYSFDAPSVAGDYTEFPSTGASGTLGAVTGTGMGAKADITMGLLSVAVTEKGSGYTNSDDAALVFSPAATPTNASATAVLTTDSGAVGSATNQENAIIISAHVGGGQQLVGDIIKQTNTRSYKVKTADGVAVCKLVATDTLSPGEAFIKATDANGSTYFVTKLTAHKATLVRYGEDISGWVFASGVSVPWTFDSTANGRVIIENA